MTKKEIGKKGIQLLEEKKIDSASLKARLLLAYCCHTTKEKLLLQLEEEATKEQQEQYWEGIEQLKKGIPLQYILQKQEFMKLDFYVNSSVLIPQPDTEILVEEMLKLEKMQEPTRILDLGTGSGAIAISLCVWNPNIQVVGVDISKEALAVAKKNAKIHQVEKRIQWLESDLFEKVEGKFDVIVSNPPYIATKEIQTLEKEVQNEPRLALDGGMDGLKFYRRIVKEAKNYLKIGGYLGLEIGYDQKEKVMELLQEAKGYSEITVKQDLAGRNRVMIARVG